MKMELPGELTVRGHVEQNKSCLILLSKMKLFSQKRFRKTEKTVLLFSKVLSIRATPVVFVLLS